MRITYFFDDDFEYVYEISEEKYCKGLAELFYNEYFTKTPKTQELMQALYDMAYCDDYLDWDEAVKEYFRGEAYDKYRNEY